MASTFTADLDAGPDGDTITAAAWTAPDGITIDSQSLGGAVATAWLSGGTARQSYSVVCEVTTVAGRVDQRTLRVYVSDR